METLGDLFAGIGGFALAFSSLGCKTLWGVEIDKNAGITYKANFSHTLYNDDINNINFNKVKKVSILSGGFPCQSFSIAGYRKGFNDDRGNLFFSIMRAVDTIQPKVIFLENVKNISTHDKGRTLSKIILEFEKRKYYLKYNILNTYEYSEIPQNRERMYFVAFKDYECFNYFKFPSKIGRHISFKNMLENKVEDKYYYNKSKYYQVLKNSMNNNETIYQWRRIYLRENKKGICPTLTANMGMGGHNVPLIIDSKDIRKLTPRECARLQGFPDNFILPNELPDSSLYKQIGNSVSVPVIERIAENILLALSKKAMAV